MMNEIVDMILLLHILCFDDWIESQVTRNNIGYSYIAFAFFSCSVHLLLGVCGAICVSYKNLKKKYGDKVKELKI